MNDKKELRELNLDTRQIPSDDELHKSYLQLKSRFFPVIDKLYEEFLKLKSADKLYEN